MDNINLLSIQKKEPRTLSHVIKLINKKINSFEPQKILYKIEFAKNNTGGRYSNFERLIYKPDSLDEFNELKEVFGYLEEKYKILKASEIIEKIKDNINENKYKGFIDYKNTPAFIDANAVSASIKINTAHRSFRVFTNNKKQMQRSFVVYKDEIILDRRKKITQEDFNHAVAEMSDRAREAAKRFNEATNSDIFVLENHFTSAFVSVKLCDLYQYLEFDCEWMTVRSRSGKKYMARIALDEGESVETSLGCIIVHPHSDINSATIRETLPRAKSKKSLENQAIRITEIAGQDIQNLQSELWVSK